ncbi:MAG: HAMP domain-containing histidine kinase, partial [Ktedonobacteraceae bacterium]|nr:HAMP domain-containing histidine kinase [Ktedonobacteraceae bacterium]
EIIRPLSTLSLRTKLVLSYMAVTLGAIIILTFAVSMAVSNYFRENQLSHLRYAVAQLNSEIWQFYQRTGNLPNNITPDAPNDPILAVMVDNNNNLQFCAQPDFLQQSICDGSEIKNAEIKSAVSRAISEKREIDDELDAPGLPPSLYIASPLHVGNQIIGAIFLSEPDQQNRSFVQQVNEAIFLSGIVISLLVMIFSFILGRRFTQPIEALTLAAEQMKLGKYTSRVTAPKAQDELGRLAQTFNEMADTIEADVNELREQEEYRRELTANISHDLATPLTAIQGFSEALADEVISDPSERQETAQRIAREVQRLRRMVADLRNVSSLEMGQTSLDLAPLDLHTLVDETLAVIEPECDNEGIAIHNEIASDIPPVLADSDRITQVLLNLLDNARRHTPRGGTLLVGAEKQQKELCIWVKDSGSGIGASDLPHIFERFYRADRSRTTTTGGSGLGLAIVKAIITAHHGTVWAESAPGQGTRIVFTLPLAQVAEQKQSSKKAVKK